MITTYTYGFKYKNVLYGWLNKKLYRMPQNIGKRFYPLLEVKKWENKGYRVGRDKKSFKQLEYMTVFINHEVQEIKSKDLPF
jgi:hypothetical protein